MKTNIEKSTQTTKSVNEDHQFLANHNECPLCRSQLDIHVQATEVPHHVREEAYCPQCQIKTRIHSHPLH